MGPTNTAGGATGESNQPMRIVLINLKRAAERHVRMARGFGALGLSYEIKEAVDGRNLSAEHLAQVDREARRELGLYPQANGSIANWLTQREAMKDLVVNGPEMMAIFEDDARLAPELPEVLAVLEQKRFAFDVVVLQRRHPKRRFIPVAPLTSRHTAGRVRYSDSGSEGYVITRAAAQHFLETTPRMVLAIDQALSRVWHSGLNVFYVDPPVVHHGGADDSQIEDSRNAARRQRGATHGVASMLWRRAVASSRRALMKRIAFRKLLRGEIGVTRWLSESGAPEPPQGSGSMSDRTD